MSLDLFDGQAEPSAQSRYADFTIPLVSYVPPPSWSMPADIEGKIARAEGVMTRLLKQGRPVAVSWSAGKDSSLVLSLLLCAAAKLAAEGVPLPPIVVTHADTLVENPEMSLYARNEMVHVRRFAAEHRLDVTIEIAYPNLASQWAVRVIGGRALPTFPGTNRDCSQDFKVSPMKRLRKQVLKRLQGVGKALPEPVVLIGTRYEESAERARNMRERGESDIEIRRGIDENGKESHLFLSPIAYWTTDDVWEYLGMARAGVIQSYSNFEETFRVYSDSMATSCVIVAEDMYKAMKASKACGARTGCAVCTAVTNDKTMENMLAYDERYAYMRGLNQLRNFLSNTRWDMDRRSWLGRTINKGYVKIAADAYSPAMMEELLKYALTLDAVERQASRAAGLHKPRFQLVGNEQLLAIDAMWSLQAFHRPFHALKIWRDVQNGARFHVPEVPMFTRPKEMPARYLWVGQDWEDGHQMAYTGLRSAVLGMASMDGNGEGCMGTKELNDGRSVMAMNTGEMLSFDMESAYFVMEDWLEELLREYHDKPSVCPTSGYHYYVRLGCMSVKAGMEGEIDSMLRRSSFKVREGIDGQIDVYTLWARGISAEEAGMSKSNNGLVRARGGAGSRSIGHQSLAAPEDDAHDEIPPEIMTG